MEEFWESNFKKNQMMWGDKPGDSAIRAKDFFLENKVKEILIPGIGYGRNAKVFLENGISVTGIEISKTAIELARQNGLSIPIFHGSVTEMPFENKLYDGIFCFALIHLLSSPEREKFILDCYHQLKPGGYMIFTIVTKKAPLYAMGKKLGKDYYEVLDGLKMFFYDADSVKQEFGKAGLIDLCEIEEPHKDKAQPPFQFIMATCQKKP